MRRKRVYDHETLRDEREYGFYWYSGIWNILRPVLIALAALLIVLIAMGSKTGAEGACAIRARITIAGNRMSGVPDSAVRK